MKTTLSITAAIAISVVGYVLWPGTDQPTSSQEVEVAVADKALADIVLPDTLSVNAQIGKRGFDANCAACHGTNAVGQDGVAPPLIHIIYEPSHHGDESFQRAVAMGVRGHHWPFGSMPPIEGLNRGDVTMITAYIREVQRANGIN
ncbi:cytochrome c [uncultured Tateyamaria sp.]|uniref:c-type cytochrome n=1 Tax=uncultured Tateyamaria sp. TaxID=455651 RepID=UPI0026070651|nr:cytochrome c [uncultured Tateyamaria sp.]